ncbi:hypothetical protein LJY25_01500 [Hymenobacter sp. BT175]|uniref:hypothetical protein n=1 Tax=Hymenobacter translucens TaxID=2886507 RepID=UPI001D0EE002|nr:hypothetical protein [Hymenobacter translucens]MCC2545106.1 hypothetical protein [Hymenobacter translucens]
MTASATARFASFLLILALLGSGLSASAAAASTTDLIFGKGKKSGRTIHRPNYKRYKPGCKWIFQK